MHLLQGIVEFYPFYFQGKLTLVTLILILKPTDHKRINLSFLYIIIKLAEYQFKVIYFGKIIYYFIKKIMKNWKLNFNYLKFL